MRKKNRCVPKLKCKSKEEFNEETEKCEKHQCRGGAILINGKYECSLWNTNGK